MAKKTPRKTTSRAKAAPAKTAPAKTATAKAASAKKTTKRSKATTTDSNGKKQATEKSVSRTAAAPERPPIVSWKRRQEMIAEAAYYRAERRGFRGGDPSDDWNQAEAEIDALLSTRDV